jgi:hypothetical protein
MKISTRYAISFLLLLIVMMELHEILHITTGKILCGCWGPRDFNVWALCEGCKETQPLWWIATAAGPLFSFALMWLGMVWLGSDNPNMKALGFSFIFSNIPFGRMTTVMMGGGDEMVVVRNFMGEGFTRTEKIIVGSIMVMLLGAPPIVMAWREIQNRNRWLIFLGFLTAPLLFLLLYTLNGLNAILEAGFLAEDWIMGTPLLITLHTALAAILLVLSWKNLHLLVVNPTSQQQGVRSL